MDSIDITSDGLREKGYLVKKEGNTIALYHDESCMRSTIYKNDWNKTVKQVEKQFAEKNAGIDNLALQHVISCMSTNYGRLVNEVGISARTPKKEQGFWIQMASKSTRANCSAPSSGTTPRPSCSPAFWACLCITWASP